MKKMKEKFAKLKSHYGSHSEVARKLGITPRHYQNMRKSPEKIRNVYIKLMDYLILHIRPD